MMRKIGLAIVLAVAAFAGFGAVGQHVTIGNVTFYYQIPDVGTFGVLINPAWDIFLPVLLTR